MEFGWINLFGACIVVLIMIPNIIYAINENAIKENAIKGKHDEEHGIGSRCLSACEQVGRYGCIVLMWLPLLTWKFGFRSLQLYFLDLHIAELHI